jgi:tetratricopeptide (TPR) repeat protein
MRRVALGVTLVLIVASAPRTTLDPGLGELRWPVSTRNAEAQQFFDQGMKYVYAFNHEAAVRSFTRATVLDPNLAMGYWGAALALGPNINLDVDPEREKQAYDTVQKALKHLSGASAREAGLVRALARRYSVAPGADLKQLNADYSRAMGELSKKYPHDLNIATLYAESLMDLRPWRFWSHDGTPAEGAEEIVAVLESVLRRDPNHLGANHYLIHALEASPHPERALRSATRLQTLAPAAGHLVHMPAHIYQRTGNYAGAARANEVAAHADREFIRRNGREGVYPLMYYNHNLQFGSAAYAMIGRFDDAKRMAGEFGSNAAAAAKEMPMLEAAAASPQLILVRFGRWSDILRTPPADSGPLSRAYSHFARASALAQLGDLAAARAVQTAFENVRKDVPDDPGFYQNPQSSVAAVASRVLAGRMAMASGDRAKAIAAYREAVALEDALNYDEPPDWFYPVRETLGAALLRDGRPAEAERVFREDLRRNPHNPRSLFGLAQALRAQKKGASATEREFGKVWNGAALRIEDM